MAHLRKDEEKRIRKIKIIAGLGVLGFLGSIIFLIYSNFEPISPNSSVVIEDDKYTGQTVPSIDGPYLSKEDFKFSMVDLKGQQIQLKELKGKVLFINIWASWCPPCVKEMPTIQSLYDVVKNQKNIKVILLSLDEAPEKAVMFLRSRNLKIPNYFPTTDLPEVLQSTGLPTTFVISKEGQIIYKKEGAADYSASVFKKWLIKQAS